MPHTRWRLSAIAASLMVAASHGQPVPVQESGSSARAYAMGNSFVAVANDLTVTYWNPAGLAFTPVRQLGASAEVLSNNARSTFFGTQEASTLSRLRIANAGLVRAIPTARGGLAFSIAYSSPYAFDDISTFSGVSGGTSYDKEYSDYGSLHLWGGGVGVQVARGLGVGVSAALITGSDHQRTTFSKQVNGKIVDPIYDAFDRNEDRSYWGIDVRLGALYVPVDGLRLGVRFGFPQVAWFAEHVQESYPGTVEPGYAEGATGRIFSSYTGALGASWALSFLTLAADVHGRAPYGLAYPSERIPVGSAAAHSSLGAGAGVELPIQATPVLLRGGYCWDQFDMFVFARRYTDEAEADTWDAGGVKADAPRQRVTAGVAYVGDSFVWEGAYGYEFWKLSTFSTLSEVHGQHRLAVTFSFRY